jgi:diacylglycerol kinase family enzyme
MRVTLVHNPEAGTGDHVGGEILARLREAGHEPIYVSTEAADLTRGLDSSPDLVLAAGGDGTVGAVARLMAAKTPDVPLSVLPIGTANNIARALGVTGNVDDIVRGLGSGTERTLDIATARAAWGTVRFVESAGIGIFAAMLRDAEREETTGTSEDDASTPRHRGSRMQRMLDRARPRHWRIEADGEDLSASYLMVAALNIPYVGPGLALAPNADAGDGQLDLLLVTEAERQALGDFLAGFGRGEEPTITIPTRRVRHARLEWSAAHGYIDDHLWPDGGRSANRTALTDAMTDVEAADRSLRVLVPDSLSS